MRRPSLPKLRRRSTHLTPQEAVSVKPERKRRLPRIRTQQADAGSKPPRRRPSAPVAALAVLAIAAGAAIVSAAGGESDEEEVRQTLARFAEANRTKDYQALCDDLYATRLVEQVRNAGVPCEVSMRIGLESVTNPRIEVLSVTINGDSARARVRSVAAAQQPSVDTIRLVKEDGGWRIASLVNSATTRHAFP